MSWERLISVAKKYPMLAKTLRNIRRGLGMSPTQMVFNEMKKRGVNVKSLNALEVFGGSGDYHTKDYAKKYSV